MLAPLKTTVSPRHLILLVGDAACVLVAVYLGLFLYFSILGYPFAEHFLHLSQKWPVLCVVVGVHILAFYFADMYNLGRFRGDISLFLPLFYAILGSFLFLSMLFFFIPQIYGRGVTMLQSIILLGLMLAWRRASLTLMGILRREKRVLIVGAGKGGTRAAQTLQENPHYAYTVVGFIDDDPSKHNTYVCGVPVLGGSADLPRFVNEHDIDQIVLAITHKKSPDLVRRLVKLSQNGIYVTDAMRLCERLTGRIPANELTELWFLDHSLDKTRFFQRRVKRIMDVILASLGLIIGFVPMALAALLIKLTSRGPIFFTQERVGQFGKPFRIVKLRTMVHNAEEATGAVMTARDDPRITPVGRFLRRTRIDEIPQLWNVLKGEMSLVGPRPERQVFVEKFQQEIPFYLERLSVQPGITGWSQVKYPYAASLEETRVKLEYDLYYIKHISPLLDLLILAMTFKTILTGRGR